MKRRSHFYFLVIIVVVLLIIKSFAWINHSNSDKELFKNSSHLILTKHVKCRMSCRHITKEEIKEILKNGSINYSKSGMGSKGDSTFALEGYSHENQHIRIVVAPESDGLVVITCIDLGHKWPCDCY